MFQLFRSRLFSCFNCKKQKNKKTKPKTDYCFICIAENTGEVCPPADESRSWVWHRPALTSVPCSVFVFPSTSIAQRAVSPSTVWVSRHSCCERGRRAVYRTRRVSPNILNFLWKHKAGVQWLVSVLQMFRGIVCSSASASHTTYL